MAAAASSGRRSARTSQQPLTYAEQQAASALSALEQRDVAAALRLSLQDSWDSDEEKSGADSAAAAVSSSSDEEKENQPPAAVEQEGEWTSNVQKVDIPLPRLRPVQQAAPAEQTPFTLLQRFLSPALMEEFAAHTNAAAPQCICSWGSTVCRGQICTGVRCSDTLSSLHSSAATASCSCFVSSE